MAKSSIDIVISTILKKTGIDAATSALKKLGGGIKSFSVGAFKNLTNIFSGFQMLGKSIQVFSSALSKGMEFERMTVQFKSLTGSMELARKHMMDLQDLGRTPPFSLEQFAAASQAMLKMTGGMAGFKEQMEIVGDLAAATGNDIATVGRAFGLAYQVIRDGQDFGRAGQQLYSLGIMTKAQVAEFAELSKSGENNRAVWEKLTEVFGRYKGAMAETESTTKGLVESIQGEATVAITDFSRALSEEAKPALEGVLGWLKRINEDGSIEAWAEGCVNWLHEVVEEFDAIKEAIQAVGKEAQKDIFDKSRKGGEDGFWTSAANIIPAFMSVGSGIKSKLLGGSYLEGYNAGKAKFGFGAWSDEGAREFARLTGTDNVDIRDASEADREADRALKAAVKKERREREAAEAKAEAERRLEQDLAAAQERTDKRLAEEREQAAMELAKKEEAERQKLVEKETAARLKAEAKAEAELHAARVANAQAEIKAKQENERTLQDVTQRAQNDFERAFSMYRSEDKGAAQIAEERAYSADYKRLLKDADRYGGKWRIDELSRLMMLGDTAGQAATLEEWRKSKRFTPEVESMVRAVAADRTRSTAADELRKLNATTEKELQMLEELLRMKGD